MNMHRRHFLGTTLAASLIATCRAADSGRRPQILLRSSWQDVNIGDIAHTPGVLALLEKFVPQADVVLWASGGLTSAVAAMEQQRFPKLRIVKGSIKNGEASTPELAEAIEQTDFLLHGSGPSFVAARDTAEFVSTTGKPFGVYGITYGGGDAGQRQLLSQAKFVYFRDSVSLAKAHQDGITSPIMEFGPDGAFAADVTNDAEADSFLESHDLQPGRFLCCIPRLRFTPYWLIKPDRKKDDAKAARNEELREHDHAPLRDAITAVVRETGYKVLVCPEDMTHMAVGRDNIMAKLPTDVLKSVVWRENFWLTDEALSTYRRSAGMFGLEMHSPIMCIGNGIPAIVCRFEEQTSKGFMWRDIGLDDWLFDADQPEQMQRFTDTVLNLIRDPEGAQKKVAAAQAIVQKRQRETLAVLAGCLSK